MRNEFLSMRNKIPKGEVLERSKKIINNLIALKEYNESRTIMYYVSFNNEVYTHDIIKKELKQRKIAIPKVVNQEIEPSLIIDFGNLISTGKFGILEPIELLKVSYKNIDSVILPGLVFDKKGNRIGYGYGHYDKFLGKVKHAVKIGLAYDFQIVDEVPNDKHDVPVDFIVSEK